MEAQALRRSGVSTTRMRSATGTPLSSAAGSAVSLRSSSPQTWQRLITWSAVAITSRPSWPQWEQTVSRTRISGDRMPNRTGWFK